MNNARFSELKLHNTVITNNKEIEIYLSNSIFYWLLDCEVDNVKIEIKDDVLYWNNGIFYFGNWIWGVFKKGEFRSGIWNGGIFYDGIFTGNWIRGVKKGGEINDK